MFIYLFTFVVELLNKQLLSNAYEISAKRLINIVTIPKKMREEKILAASVINNGSTDKQKTHIFGFARLILSPDKKDAEPSTSGLSPLS